MQLFKKIAKYAAAFAISGATTGAANYIQSGAGPITAGNLGAAALAGIITTIALHIASPAAPKQ